MQLEERNENSMCLFVSLDFLLFDSFPLPSTVDFFSFTSLLSKEIENLKSTCFFPNEDIY